MEDRYSRQLYSIGQDVMLSLSKAKVLIIGYTTVSLEIIKNLALLGIQNIDIHTTTSDSTNYKYFRSDTGLPFEDLIKLNPTITISEVHILNEFNQYREDSISKYNLVICINRGPIEYKLSRITRILNIPFIMTGAYGLMGFVFNDFGPTFTINDQDGDTYENLIIESISNKTINFKENHHLSDKDILITEIDGILTYLQVHETKTPLIIEMTEVPEQDLTKYNRLIKKKIPKTITFKALDESITNIDTVFADTSVPFTRSNDLHEIHNAYSFFTEMYPNSELTYERLTQFIDDYDSKPDEFKIIAKKFCLTSDGDFLPIASIIGAVCSHEVLKCLGKKYTPISQWYYMDSYELIDDSEVQDIFTHKRRRTETKYSGIINALGEELTTKLQRSKPFVIGAGAIGCELLKNLSMLGIRDITITDMDHIEKSNLSRQFLFNDHDMRQSKATTAANKIQQMNPDITVTTYTQKVCSETELIFNSEFSNSITVYLNALDNVEARLYVDSQAIKYQKPLIDSGTLGAKGNVQVIIPYLTESYGSATDPDDKTEIPICTIKSFPFKQAHTIQWARELFETEFNEIPSKIAKYNNITNLEKATPTEIQQLIRNLYKYRYYSSPNPNYHKILSHIFIENFDYNTKELLSKYTDPSKKPEGKILPIILDYTNYIPEINEFMTHGYKIMNQVFKTDYIYDPSTHTDLLDLDAIDINYEEVTTTNDFTFVHKIITGLHGLLHKVEFEKDDDTLGHVSWLFTTSNIRNSQYKIEQSDLPTTRKISGNIIPAMITTTSLIAGYQVLEYIKLIKYYDPDEITDINKFKNRFVNLNTNYIDGITPMPAPKVKIGSIELSLWDRIAVNTYNVKEILENIYDITSTNAEFIMHGKDIVYDGEDILIDTIDFTHKLVCIISDIEIPIYYEE
ncbi:MAG: ubiquitin-activating enzyme [Gaeavirus sp.]|uniref:Ubiquitin-activating enzyme n=1 Tax=Gaeavirus sp. TaxID=2487767 RepID=A0A3G5A1K2_9VIRU|nr:MAG: ubiquitin-activating enzyme [Gaeavirus sp.]